MCVSLLFGTEVDSHVVVTVVIIIIIIIFMYNILTFQCYDGMTVFDNVKQVVLMTFSLNKPILFISNG